MTSICLVPYRNTWLGVLVFLVAHDFAVAQDGSGPDADRIRSAFAEIRDQPTLTTYGMKRSDWMRADTVEITRIEGDTAYYLTDQHSIFDGRTREPIPLQGQYRERDGHKWVVAEIDQEIAFWQYGNESLARLRNNLAATETQVVLRDGEGALASLSFDSEGRQVSSHTLPLDTDLGGLVVFKPIGYWSTTARGAQDLAEGLMDMQEEGLYRKELDSVNGRGFMTFEAFTGGGKGLMLREAMSEFEDEKFHYSYLGTQRFGGLGLPTAMEMDWSREGGRWIREVRVGGIGMKFVDESDFQEAREGLVLNLDE